MSAPHSSQPSAIKSRPRASKVKDAGSANGQQPAIRLKVVIRHIPSLLTETEFRALVGENINDESSEYFRWEGGKVPEDRNKLPRPARCYVKLKKPEYVTSLSNTLRNLGPITDSKGNTSTPQMEFAPYQKVPKKTQRVDARAGTIESDPDFQSFLNQLRAGIPAAPPKPNGEGESTTEAAPPVELDLYAPAPIPENDPLSVPMPTGELIEKPKTTPLIEHIRAQKAGPQDKSISKGKAAERAQSSGDSSRASKRAERRAREKAAKKARDAPVPDPPALLKRADTAPQPRLNRANSSNLSSLGPKAIGETALAKDTGDKEKGRRERRRGGASNVAAILQRDLGLAGPVSRRSRGARVAAVVAAGAGTSQLSTAETPTTPTDNGPEKSNSVPTSPATTSAPSAPQLSREKTPKPVPSREPRPHRPRRERRIAGLEREESNVSNASADPTSPQASPRAAAPPLAILKKQGTNPPAPPPAMSTLLRRESSAASAASVESSTTVVPTQPQQQQQAHQQAPIPNTPTGPRAGGGRMRRGGRGGRGGGGDITVNVTLVQQTVNTAPPTGPAGMNGRGGGPTGGGRGGRGRGGHGGYRGGRREGRGGGGGPRGGGGGGGGAAATGGQGPTGPPAGGA
ncbi:Smg-4/UPF3 family-domain-containing protein [Geopyxis carbonaria]|nr:Smg-4/UPF3 family-domain-containing protein [Geopyxis carbonaria]